MGESDCMDAARRGQCLPKCRKYQGDSDCCAGPPPECPARCVEQARYGFCPTACKIYEGDINCCAPTCPAKCTNRRRGSCAAGGVAECNNIPGCCPDQYDVLFGAVAFDGKSNDGTDSWTISA